jgi:hypothetical protein
MFQLARTSAPECESQRIGCIVWGWRSLQCEELRNRLGYRRLGCTTFTSDGALHLRWRGFNHFNLVIGSDEQRNAAHGTDCNSGLHVGLREDALNGDAIWSVLHNE